MTRRTKNRIRCNRERRRQLQVSRGVRRAFRRPRELLNALLVQHLGGHMSDLYRGPLVSLFGSYA